LPSTVGTISMYDMLLCVRVTDVTGNDLITAQDKGLTENTKYETEHFSNVNKAVARRDGSAHWRGG